MPREPKPRRRAQRKDGLTFASAFLEHDHVLGMTTGLCDAGAKLKWAYDPDPRKLASFLGRFPQAKAARSFEEILDDGSVGLVASAGVPCDRGPTGCRV